MAARKTHNISYDKCFCGDTAAGKYNKYFFPIRDSMIKHPAFIGLKHRTKWVLFCCLMQTQEGKAKASLYKHAEENGRQYDFDHCFVFPDKQMRSYGLEPRHARDELKELEKRGFIKKIEGNKERREVNVYQFTDSWKDTS